MQIQTSTQPIQTLNPTVRGSGVEPQNKFSLTTFASAYVRTHLDADPGVVGGRSPCDLCAQIHAPATCSGLHCCSVRSTSTHAYTFMACCITRRLRLHRPWTCSCALLGTYSGLCMPCSGVALQRISRLIVLGSRCKAPAILRNEQQRHGAANSRPSLNPAWLVRLALHGLPIDLHACFDNRWIIADAHTLIRIVTITAYAHVVEHELEV
mgnify:CR=1 FL=1